MTLAKREDKPPVVCNIGVIWGDLGGFGPRGGPREQRELHYTVCRAI
jgi:hypothetical protein